MGKFSFSCIIILIYFAQPMLSQTYVKLFYDYLPEKYLSEEDNLEQVEYSLNQFAQTNPDLIYYYLHYLNSIAEQKVFNRDSNYYNILQYEISKSSSYNNAWVDEEIIKAKNLQQPELIYEELESLLDEFRAPESNAPKYKIELKTDKNLQKFFAYKCLTWDTTLIYDENIDYHNAVNAAIENFISRIKSDYKTMHSDVNDILETKLQELLQYHVFSKGFSEGEKRKTEFKVAEYLQSLIDYPEFMESSSITFGFNHETMRYNFPGDKIIEPYLPYQEFTLEDITNSMIFYNLTAGYRIKLKEYKSAFSHLDINFDWSFSSRKTKGEAKSTVIDKYFFIWEGEPSNFTLLFNGTINSVSWEINEFSALTANIKLPVFYYDRRLFFEIGLQYKYLFYEYLVTVDREIVDQTATDPAILGPEIETLNHKSSSHLFGGSIIVNYSIINSLNIKGIISTFPSAQLGFEYFLSL